MPSRLSHSFFASRLRVFLLPALGLLVALIGVVLLWGSPERTSAWVGIGCGAFVTLWTSAPMWRREPMIWFDDAGLQARWPGFDVVAWHDITSVRLVRVRRRAWLAVDRTAHARSAAARQPLQQVFAKLAKVDDLAIPLDGLQARPEQVAAVIELALAHARGQR
ncbi:MAG TPA: hypothetical protein VF384_12750 [Planctomycetota bacterium]